MDCILLTKNQILLAFHLPEAEVYSTARRCAVPRLVGPWSSGLLFLVNVNLLGFDQVSLLVFLLNKQTNIKSEEANV